MQSPRCPCHAIHGVVLLMLSVVLLGCRNEQRYPGFTRVGGDGRVSYFVDASTIRRATGTKRFSFVELIENPAAEYDVGEAMVDCDTLRSIAGEAGHYDRRKHLISNTPEHTQSITSIADFVCAEGAKDRTGPNEGTDITSIEGKYAFNVIAMPSIKSKLTALLDDATFKDFSARLQVAGPVKRQGEWLVGSGLAPHSGGSDEAAFAIDVNSGAMFGVMMTDGHVFRSFGVDDPEKLPAPLLEWYRERGGSLPHPAKATEDSEPGVQKAGASQIEQQDIGVNGPSTGHSEIATPRSPTAMLTTTFNIPEQQGQRDLMPNEQRSDPQIEMDVVRALNASNALKKDPITAVTIQSEVTLSGRVSNEPAKELAEWTVGHVHGVTKVHNYLVTVNPAQPHLNIQERQTQGYIVPNEQRSDAQGAGENAEASQRTSGEAYFSGIYSGVVHNLTGNLSSAIGIIAHDNDGSIEGCLGVHAPLYGSGPLRGLRRASKVDFEVKGVMYTLLFHGVIQGEEISGSYTASVAGRSPEDGQFKLKREKNLPPGPIGRCLTDAEINSR